MKEEKVNPGFVFSPDDQKLQEVFYQTIDAICATLDSVRTAGNRESLLTTQTVSVLTVSQAPEDALLRKSALLQPLFTAINFPLIPRFGNKL